MSHLSGRRLRVLHVMASTAGGVGVHVLQLARLLDRRRFEMTVAFGPGYPLDDLMAKTGVRVVHLPLSRGLDPARNLRGLLALWRLLRSEQFDITHTHTSVGGAVGRLAAHLTRVPVTLWTTHLHASLAHLPSWRRRAYLAAERIMDRWTTYYVATTEAMKRQGVAKGIMPPEKVSVIDYGVDLTPFVTEPDVPSARVTLGLPPTGTVVGILGRFEPQKGIDEFLLAASMIAKERSDTTFLIVGDGPLRPRLEALAQNLGLGNRVRFSGWLTDVAVPLAAMNVLCLTSHWEAGPYVVLEAMAARRPVVATDVGDVRNMVVEGTTGRIVPRGEPAPLANAVLTILAEPDHGRRMGEAGRCRVEQRFSLQVFAESHEALYERLCQWASARRAPGILAARPYPPYLSQETI